MLLAVPAVARFTTTRAIPLRRLIRKVALSASTAAFGMPGGSVASSSEMAMETTGVACSA